MPGQYVLKYLAIRAVLKDPSAPQGCCGSFFDVQKVLRPSREKRPRSVALITATEHTYMCLCCGKSICFAMFLYNFPSFTLNSKQTSLTMNYLVFWEHLRMN